MNYLIFICEKMNLLYGLIVALNLCCLNNCEDEINQNKTEMIIDPECVRLHLYTSFNFTHPQFDWSVNDTESVTNDTYNSTNSLTIIVHGFQGTVNDSTLLLIKEAYLYKTGWNVIMIDWGPLSKVPRYEVAVQNANCVAKLFAHWLSSLNAKGLVNLTEVHMIGFSMGSHIAGIIGKGVNGEIGKIFALDPAYPLYDHNDLSRRLHTNDAKFVEVIHTCGSHISFEKSIGHVDFYPNGGKFPQPLCLDSKTGSWGMAIITIMVCSHTIAVQYFADTVFNETKYMASKCDSWRDFRKQNCSDELIPMGFITPTSARGDYYLNIIE